MDKFKIFDTSEEEIKRLVVNKNDESSVGVKIDKNVLEKIYLEIKDEFN